MFSKTKCRSNKLRLIAFTYQDAAPNKRHSQLYRREHLQNSDSNANSQQSTPQPNQQLPTERPHPLAQAHPHPHPHQHQRSHSHSHNFSQEPLIKAAHNKITDFPHQQQSPQQSQLQKNQQTTAAATRGAAQRREAGGVHESAPEERVPVRFADTKESYQSSRVLAGNAVHISSPGQS